MSVLYKALQKAEKENEQRQTIASGKGFDPERLAGSGAIKLAHGGRYNWRLMGTSIFGLLAILILGIYFVTKTQPVAGPHVAVLTRPASPTTSQPAAQPPAAQSTEPSRPEQVKPAAAGQSVATATPPIAGPATPKTEATEVSPNGAAVEAVTTAIGPAAPASTPSAQQAQTAQVASAPPATPHQPAAPGMEVATAQASNAPPETQVAKVAPVVKSAPEKAEAFERPKPVEIPPNSPAQMLSPPISIARSDFALSGVGRAVQVRQIAQEAQDNVGAGYNALLRGEYDTALAFYDQALAKEPTSVLGLLGRGAALQKLRRFEEAQEAYAKALKVDPQNREALTNVTSIIAERAPAEALNRLLDLEKEYPAFSPIKAQIGLLYAKMGTMDQALDYLRRAVALSPEAVMYQYNLALVLDHMNLREQAVDAYQRVLGAISLGEAPPELSSTQIERRVRFLRVH